MHERKVQKHTSEASNRTELLVTKIDEGSLLPMIFNHFLVNHSIDETSDNAIDVLPWLNASHEFFGDYSYRQKNETIC